MTSPTSPPLKSKVFLGTVFKSFVCHSEQLENKFALLAEKLGKFNGCSSPSGRAKSERTFPL